MNDEKTLVLLSIAPDGTEHEEARGTSADFAGQDDEVAAAVARLEAGEREVDVGGGGEQHMRLRRVEA